MMEPTVNDFWNTWRNYYRRHKQGFTYASMWAGTHDDTDQQRYCISFSLGEMHVKCWMN